MLAAIEPAGAAALLRQLVTDVVAVGTLIQSVPHEITNEAPELLSRQDLEDAFARLLDQTAGWGILAEEHYGRIVEPDHLQRSLDMVERLAGRDSLDSNWLDGQADDGSDLPEAARLQLLREVFASGYEELA